MLRNYFELTEDPFGVTPDSRFLYLGAQHREALASLVYGIESNRGFLALIAKPGMGKTTLLYQVMEYLRGRTRTAFVFRTDCDSREFIRYVLIDLGIDVAGKDLPAMHEALNQVLAADMRAGRRLVLVIDEAQNLEEKVLESIRLFSNFETPRMKLMQIVIAGQPGLAEKLSRPSMAQLRQRISSVIRIVPLNSKEIDAYIDHRLSMVGCKDSGLFSTGARSLIAEHSEGIPRKINNICFNAMSLACALKKRTIERATVLEVLADFDLESLIEKPPVTQGRGEAPSRAISPPQRLRKRKRSWLRGWAGRFAVAGMLVLCAVIGVTNGEVQAADATAKMDDPVVPRTSVPAQIPPDPQVIEPSREEDAAPARASEWQTLYQISGAHLGRHDPQVFAKIRTLNPWLRDPRQVRVGQRILVPSPWVPSAHGQNSALQEFPSFPQEMGKK